MSQKLLRSLQNPQGWTDAVRVRSKDGVIPFSLLDAFTPRGKDEGRLSFYLVPDDHAEIAKAALALKLADEKATFTSTKVLLADKADLENDGFVIDIDGKGSTPFPAINKQHCTIRVDGVETAAALIDSFQAGICEFQMRELHRTLPSLLAENGLSLASVVQKYDSGPYANIWKHFGAFTRTGGLSLDYAA